MLTCCVLTALLGVQPTAPDPEEAARRTVVWLREMKTAVAAAPPERALPPLAEAADQASASELIHELASRCEPQRLDASAAGDRAPR